MGEDPLNPFENVLTPAMDNQMLEEYEILRSGKKLNIRFWDDETLSAVCGPIENNEFGDNLAEFGNLLASTMENSGTGVGLAASQVGLRKRMFAMKLVDTYNSKSVVICNPVLSNFKGRALANEGCLSLPKVYEQVERAESVHLAYQMCNGEKFEMDLTGMEARIAMHETDHCDGIMFFQRMSKQMRKNVLRQWEKVRGKL
jgi:peptide deformylase